MSETKVVIVGAGLVGSLAAIYMARQHGYSVEVFEKRSDIRRQLVTEGKSINLALSARGIRALKEVGLDEHVLEMAMPMGARMVHSKDGQTTSTPYGDFGEEINSVGRRGLNEILINAAERERGVVFYFEHELVLLDAENGTATFRNAKNRNQVNKKADFILGCDGAYSVVRRELMRMCRLDFSQEYISHGYKEFTIPPNNPAFPSGWKLSKDHLHIWPRNEFMLIALPNNNGSFTATLFYPNDQFEKIKLKGDIVELFKTEFKDALEVMDEEKIRSDFGNNPTGSLVTMRCSRYHHKNKVLLLGDAAHAMVPFYGQGMNAGFEDLTVLNQLLSEFPASQRDQAFEKYSKIRKPDAYAACDLALYNYWEMSTAVNSKLFRFKQRLYGLLHKLMPKTLIPLYSMVAFSDIPYSQVISRNQRQETILNLILGGSAFGLVGILGTFLYKKLILASFARQ